MTSIRLPTKIFPAAFSHKCQKDLTGEHLNLNLNLTLSKFTGVPRNCEVNDPDVLHNYSPT
jgi:hypothetical protein